MTGMGARTPWAGVLIAAACTFACSDGEQDAPAQAPLDIPAGCNPLAADWSCLLPYPSDVFLVDDSTQPSGRRVELEDIAVPHTKDGMPANPLIVHAPDGFSPGNQIAALFPEPIDDSALVFHTGDVTLSQQPTSKTLLLDAETGEFVLHFAEVDPRAFDDARRALILRPLVRLQDSRRYIVAIHGLTSPSGTPIEPPEGFRRLRDRATRGDGVLAPLAKRYDAEIFPMLEQAGVPRKELQLAWDFTTRSDESSTRDMLDMRSDLLDRLAGTPPKVTVTAVTDDVDQFVFRRIDATVEVPLYVSDDKPMSTLNRDQSGRVVAKGSVSVPFTVNIPRSVGERAPGEPPGRLLQFGHGFFGTRAEADGYPSELADERGFVVVAADWWGMSNEDRFVVADVLVSNPSETARFTDRLHQGMANFLSLAAAAQGPLAQMPELQVPAGPAYDPTTLYFYGISMGHILGGVYLALSPTIERGVLSVGGADWTFMMSRAQPFSLFLLLMGSVIPDPLDQLALSFMFQLPMDRVDPLAWAPHVSQSPLAGSPGARRVLMHTGIGDTAVPNLASHLHARALGLGHLQPSPRPLPALGAVSSPHDGSAIVEFDFGIDPLPGVLAIPPNDGNDVHEGVRRLNAAKEQIDRFLRPGGTIEHTCTGACDPE